MTVSSYGPDPMKPERPDLFDALQQAIGMAEDMYADLEQARRAHERQYWHGQRTGVDTRAKQARLARIVNAREATYREAREEMLRIRADYYGYAYEPEPPPEAREPTSAERAADLAALYGPTEKE